MLGHWPYILCFNHKEMDFFSKAFFAIEKSKVMNGER